MLGIRTYPRSRLHTDGEVDSIQSLDMKLYDCVLKACSGKYEYLATKVIDATISGRGREALDVMKGVYLENAAAYRNEAAANIQFESPTGMRDLREYLVKFKHYLLIMANADQPYGDSQVLELLKRKSEPYEENSKFKALTYTFET